MRGLAVGILAGFVLGSTIVVSAQGFPTNGWFTGAKITDEARPMQMGYAAGAYDMFAWIVALNRLHEVQDNSRHFEEQLACMQRHTANLAQFTAWASTMWAGKGYMAASTLIARRC